MSMKCEERFFEIYGGEPEGLSFSPYRVCPIGAHVDHNLGKVTGFARSMWEKSLQSKQHPSGCCLLWRRHPESNRPF